MASISDPILPKTMFRPPINRAMKALDRSFFHKTIPLAAARVFEAKSIAQCRTELHDELLKLDRVSVVKKDPGQRDMKALLLKPEIRPDSKLFPSSQILGESGVDHHRCLVMEYQNSGSRRGSEDCHSSIRP